MKRLILISLLMVVGLGVQAQNRHKFDREQFDAKLRQFITSEAALSPQEVAKFFPLYNEMQKKQRALFREHRNLKRIKPADEKSCRENIRRCDEIDIQMKELQQSYHAKFLKMLPASKVYDILQAEDKFHRQMFRDAKKN